MIIRSDGVELEAEAFAPGAAQAPVLVLAHPHPLFGGTMANKVIEELFRRARERKWGVLRFNFRGVGRSTGSHDGGRGETEDVLCSVRWASYEFGVPRGRVVLAGYSFGSYVSAMAALSLADLALLVLIAPPLSDRAFPAPAGLRVPVSVFAPENDSFASPDTLRAWVEGLPQGRLSVIPGADHFFSGRTVSLVRKVIGDIAERLDD